MPNECQYSSATVFLPLWFSHYLALHYLMNLCPRKFSWLFKTIEKKEKNPWVFRGLDVARPILQAALSIIWWVSHPLPTLNHVTCHGWAVDVSVKFYVYGVNKSLNKYNFFKFILFALRIFYKYICLIQLSKIRENMCLKVCIKGLNRDINFFFFIFDKLFNWQNKIGCALSLLKSWPKKCVLVECVPNSMFKFNHG